jgi:hypothetical protein
MQDLKLSNKKITNENYADTYGNKKIYFTQLYLYEPDSYLVSSIAFSSDSGQYSNWNLNDAEVSTVNQSLYVLNDDNTAILLTNALSDFSVYDLSSNVLAWDEIFENTGGTTMYELGRIKRFYDDDGLAKRLRSKTFTPYKANVEGRSWVEVGDVARIKIPETDYSGNIYDLLSGQLMDCDGYLVDETGAYVYADGTPIQYDEETNEYEHEPISGTVRMREMRSIILSRTLSGIQALTDDLETKGD